jgi:hypothetical protein
MRDTIPTQVCLVARVKRVFRYLSVDHFRIARNSPETGDFGILCIFREKLDGLGGAPTLAGAGVALRAVWLVSLLELGPDRR